jgi:ankyrin repeat protein
MKNRTLAPLLSLLFIATLLASHLRAMDDSDIIPRPPAKEFAYHRCIPKLLSLAIKKSSYDDIKKKVPNYYQAYDYALKFKSDAEKTNAIEAINLETLRKKADEINPEIFEKDFEYGFLTKRPFKCLKHLLDHADLTREMLDRLLLIVNNNASGNANHVTGLQTIKYLINLGARGEFFDYFQDKPLHYAIIRHALLGENLILNHGNDGSLSYVIMNADTIIKTGEINEQIVNEGTNGSTPLNLAAACNLSNMVEKMAPYASQENKNDSLQLAVKHSSEASIMPLIINGANVNAKEVDRNTPLRSAAKNGCTNIAQLLINNNAAVNAENFSSTPLHDASTYGHIDMVKLLIKNGADINALDFCCDTPLSEAVLRNSNDIAELLLDNGANIAIPLNILENTLLHIAVNAGFHVGKPRLYHHNGANLIPSSEDMSTMIDPSEYETADTSMAALLMSKGIDINAKNNDGYTPLRVAANWNNIAIIRLLLENNADVTIQADDNLTPLDLAKQWHNDTAIQLLEQATYKKSSTSSINDVANKADHNEQKFSSREEELSYLIQENNARRQELEQRIALIQSLCEKTNPTKEINHHGR